MAIQIACRKCGVGIEVSTEQIKEASDLGTALNVEHEICPRDRRDDDPIYHFTITLNRKIVEDGKTSEEKIAQVGDQVQAETFQAALPELLKSINKQWERVAQMAEVADQDLSA